MDLLTRLKTGREAVRVVTLDGVTVGFRLLTDEDYRDAGLAAAALLKDAGEADVRLATADLLEEEKSTCLLSRFLLDPATKQPLFATVGEARRAVTREWKAALLAAYLDYERDCSPSARTLDGADFSALLEEVKKSAGATDLSASSSATLRKLIRSLACQPAASPTGNGST